MQTRTYSQGLPVTCKWTYKLKKDAEGKVQRYKARLVARGFSQTPGTDFSEIYSPVARNTSIRTLLAIANHEDFEIDQIDIETAFLHGDLAEEIYMEQPKGFEKKGKDGEKLVCKLKRSLYGLKQS
ncbi:MAG: hypothetical protein GY799_24700, partial [Desulfobulbaceae bacterium]|nr:hypothetical protein [Desulfobulbaceae bacterium]